MWRAPLIGFSPTCAVDAIAFCNAPVDHVVTTLLTAAVMDAIGGVANDAQALTRSATRSPHGGWDGHRARLTARVLLRPGGGRRRPVRRRGPVRSR
ncbi:DUF6368 family protein [Streptomyces sp. NPDC047453]|uniref:DUF6368 family protein n=1 Tax=Streptomyces sp. NPDC047453 TaxID=3154812 RepID=UPI0033FC5F87